MKSILSILKLLLVLVLTTLIFSSVYFLFLSPKENRKNIASALQGYKISETMFRILNNQYPKYSDAWMERSIAFNKRGDYAKGFELLNKAVDLNPIGHLGYRGWLRLVKLKDYQGSLSDLKQLDSLTPSFMDYPWGDNIFFLQGICYQGLGDYEKAKEMYSYYYALEKTGFVNPRAYSYHGKILIEQDSCQNSLCLLNKAIDEDPYRTEAYFYKGQAFNCLDELDSARIYLDRALTLFDKGYNEHDPYNEVFLQLYRSDIIEQMKIVE